MLDKLQESNLGCRVGDEYVGCVSYADDVVLLAPTISALRGMIKICENYAEQFKMKFNGQKSQLLVCDRNNNHNEIYITVAGEKVENVKSLKYLGHMLLSDRNDPHIDYIKRDFNCKVNCFLGNTLSSVLKNELFNTYCMSLYGSNICNLDDTSMEPLYVEWRKAIKRVWRIPYRTHTSLLYHIAETVPPSVVLKQKFINMFYGGLKSKNPLVRFIFMNAKCNNTRIGKKINIYLQ